MSHPSRTARRVVTTCTIALLAAGLAACGTTESPTTTSTTPAAQATGRAALVLDDGWVKAAEAPGAMTAMFGMLRNPTDHAVTVTGGSSEVATAVELHETTMTDAGTMQMQPKPGGFTIPAGGTQVLQPGGDHVMLMGLRSAVESGTSTTVTLTTSDGDVVVTVPVRSFAGAEESYVPTPAHS